ncbi:cell wall metabolism sensor histidine kinase WalK [Rubeoparvulum massiliense]|uniref:cell wall metabolism sensor histidine kinase WalK n=1 Tax=Rubeoparvulum massiliense TaxID=1631346 RepID=UPI00065DD100|nr:cell wall metabolism sensor histidine kinase WalK [Rubeoparvulum massiliense]
MKRIPLFHSIRWKLVVIYILLILAAMQVMGVYFIRSIESHYMNSFNEQLDIQANLLAVNLERYLDDDRIREEGSEETRNEDINHLVENLFALNGVDVQIINRNGVIISTPGKDKQLIGQKNLQTEVIQALSGARSESTRIDASTGQRMKVLATPIKRNNQVVGVIYMIASLERLYQTIGEINKILATGTGIGIVLTAAMTIFLSRTLTTPIKEITRQATRMAEGDFNQAVKVYSNDEVGYLGQVINQLSNRLKEALAINREEEDKLTSILTNMSDGVIATSRDGTIILANQRAIELLNIPSIEVAGKKLEDFFPLPDNFQFDNDQSEVAFRLFFQQGQENYVLDVVMSWFRIGESGERGIIAVLHDVTEQEKLDRERKDFVANVSHELRTPLTTLRSYLEALADGAMEDPEVAGRFLRVTQQETERMIRLVNDLLQLSRIDSGEEMMQKQVMSNQQFLKLVKERYEILDPVQQRVVWKIPEQATLITIDPDMLMRVLDNLLSNSIKYTPEDKLIEVSSQACGKNVEFIVRDEGIGIPREDLKRIFERFYRVDKARSRQLGGTGLGLSIAREIVRAHGGEIMIQSKEADGTTVRFTIPIASEEDELDA